MANISKKPSKDIKYFGRDFDSLKKGLIDFARVYYPNTYNDFNEASPGMMFVEMAAYVGDVLNYYVDSQFKEGKKDPSYQTQPFQYQGMGLSATGSIYGGVNKPKPIGTPVETSMVDMTPTTFKTTSSGISEINPNYGTTSMARESVMVNTLSKSVEATALMKSVKEKNIEKEKVHKEMMEQQLKILESIREKINQPAVAFFTDEGRRQVINQSRVRNSH